MREQRSKELYLILHELIKYHLQWIDEDLAFREKPVSRRILPAALTLVHECILSVNVGPEGNRAPGAPSEFATEAWFRYLYANVEEWYRHRYGARMDSGTNTMKAVVLISSTPFEMHVPMTVTKPGIPGETLRLFFPDNVSLDEDPLEWLVAPPNFDSYSVTDCETAKTVAAETAQRIRAISCRLIGADLSDYSARAVLAGVNLHLSSAADLILREDQEGRFPRAQWELQIACEAAYKGLLQQHTGTFSEHHDLFMLHEEARAFAGYVPQEWLRELPRWHEAAHLRYGLGEQMPTIFGIIEWYNLTLKIIGRVLEGIKGIKLAQASINLKMPPWVGRLNNSSK